MRLRCTKLKWSRVCGKRLDTILVRLKNNSKASRLISQFVTILSGRFMAAALQAVTILLLAKWSAPSEFGIAIAIIGIFTVAQTLGDLGVTVYSIREAARHGVSGKVKAAEWLSFWSTSAVAIVLAVGMGVAGYIINNTYYFFLLLCVWLIFERSLNVKGSIALGLGKAGVGVRNVLIRRGAHLFLFVSAVWVGIDSVLSYTISAAVTTVVVYVFTRDGFYPHGNEEMASVKSVFSECRPYWIHSLAIQIRNTDSFIVTAIGGPVQGAYYGLASRMANPLRMVPSAIASALLPFLSSTQVNARREAKFLLGLSVVMAIPYVLLAMVTPFGIAVLLGNEYLGSVLPIQIIVGTLAVSSCSSIFIAALQSRGAATLVSRISMVASFMYLLLLTVGVMVSGATGAAVGFSIGLIMQMVTLVWVYSKGLGDSYGR